MAELKTVSIIGSAGRNDDGPLMSKGLFDAMVKDALRIIKDDFKLTPQEVCLVSGGAAWADHVAVALFLGGFGFASLKLCLPCKWVESQHLDTGVDDWKTNPGRSANAYHRAFSKKLGKDTLFDIELAQQLGAVLVEGKGFHERNTDVAKSDFLIAFTFGLNGKPKVGGTLDTWQKAAPSTRKVHVSLATLRTQSLKRKACDLTVGAQ